MCKAHTKLALLARFMSIIYFVSHLLNRYGNNRSKLKRSEKDDYSRLGLSFVIDCNKFLKQIRKTDSLRN